MAESTDLKSVQFCDNCRKRGLFVEECLCNKRDFTKYPKDGFPEGDPRIEELKSFQVIT